MAKASPIQANFNGGEISSLLDARSDLKRYQTGLRRCLNFIPTVQGPLVRRPGTKYVNAVKTGTAVTRLFPFVFSTTQAYIIEAGNGYFRFYKDRAQILDAGVPYEVATPYATADIPGIKYAQSADVFYLVHPDYRPRKLSRTGHTAWTLSEIDFDDGPYLPTNVEDTTMVASGTTGSVTVTASATTGINKGAGFKATDVGRLVRAKGGSGWAWGEITAVADTTHVTVSVLGGAFPTGTPTKDWRLGLWSDTTGYPVAVTFYEDRLWFAGSVENPQRLDGSRSGDYENFAPSDPDSTVAADHAVAVTLNANDVNVIRWLMDDEKGLLAGTVGGEWIVRPSSYNEAISPTNIKAVRMTTRGSANVMAVRAGKATLFVQKSGRRLRELVYVYEDDGFRAPDLNLIAEHITLGGVTALAVQNEPQPIVWAVRGDGALLGMSYERENEVVGWHRHVIGGTSDADGTQAKVESIAVIPTPDGTGDDLWMIVQRWIGGATVRYIEYLTPIWREGNDQADAFFVDCGLTYSGTAATTITGAGHLEGETVSILADGSAAPDATVASGQFTIPIAAAKVHAGFGYTSEMQPLPLDAGAADGTARGKTKRVNKLTVSFWETGGGLIGPDEDNLDEIIFRVFGDDLGEPTPLFTGDKTFDLSTGYDTEGTYVIRQADPLPIAIRAVMPQLHTQDAA
jgi:hypothetical protein